MIQITSRNGNELTIAVKVNISGSLLEAEDAIQNACNAVGLLALPITHKSCVTRYGLQNVEVSKYKRLQGVFHESIFFWVTKTNKNNEQFTYSENLIFKNSL